MDDNDVVDYNADHTTEGARMKPLNLFASLNQHQRKNMVDWWVQSTPVGSFWFHSGGRAYQVRGHVNLTSENWDRYPPTVIYQGHDGNMWCRALYDWHRSMTRNKPKNWDAIAKGKKR